MPPDSAASFAAAVRPGTPGRGAAAAPMAPMVVALADTRWLGHHPTFFREFTGSLRRLGARVIALCPRPDDVGGDDGVAASTLIAPHASLVLRGRENDPATTALRWWRTRRALDTTEARTGWHADLVFFPYLDNYLRLLPSSLVPGLVLGRPWSGLYFRNQHLGDPGARGAMTRLARGDRLLRSPRALPFVGVLDERFDEPLARHSGREALAFPDITDESIPAAPTAIARTIREQANGRPIIGLAGSLEKRKGLLTLLRVALEARARDDWFFAAVGPFGAETFSTSEREFIDDARHRLRGSLFLDLGMDWIPDGAPYNAIVQSFDVAWAAYEGFQGSSNTLTKAALFEKPVIATEGECVGRRVVEFGLGLVFPEGEAHSALAPLRALVRGSDLHGHPLKPRFSEYRRLHSRAQLDATFRRLLGSLAV